MTECNQIDFHQQWCIFISEDNNSYDPTLSFDLETQW